MQTCRLGKSNHENMQIWWKLVWKHANRRNWWFCVIGNRFFYNYLFINGPLIGKGKKMHLCWMKNLELILFLSMFHFVLLFTSRSQKLGVATGTCYLLPATQKHRELNLVCWNLIIQKPHNKAIHQNQVLTAKAY